LTVVRLGLGHSSGLRMDLDRRAFMGVSGPSDSSARSTQNCTLGVLPSSSTHASESACMFILIPSANLLGDKKLYT
jgi:hypothetical protein